MAPGIFRVRTVLGGLIAALILPFLGGAVLSPATSVSTFECQLGSGSWTQTTVDVGTTTWSITAAGVATESGIGNATGDATLSGGVLTIEWTTTDGYAGIYTWTLDASCNGTGTLLFTDVAPGDTREGDSFASSVDGPEPVEVFPPSEPVIVSGVTRKVELQRNQSGWEPAANGVKLNNGDRVHTGFKAGVILTFPGGSRLIVGPMVLLRLTDIAVGPQGGVTVRVELQYGLVTAQINRSTGAAGDFQVKTPTTTASVRGTKFSISYDGTATTVAVTESSVEVKSNSGITRIVPSGMETRSTANSVSVPVKIGKGFTSGGLSSEKALALVTKKITRGLKKCKLDVVSNRLKPVSGGWSANFTLVKANQGIAAKPRGTAKLRLKGKKLRAGNSLAKQVLKGCR